ncbi:putative baseplate assembly protein [Salinigranum sp. GCM10025319]|uniref:putative baseplate assembly protein n=1 Tax=Salinigranum sp. GCM10025319 TaxID=3252687 RepID=UPI0036172E1C
MTDGSPGSSDGTPDGISEGDSNDAPRIDGRRRDRLAADVREAVPYYTDEWEPDEGDVGTTLLSLFAELAEEVTERLDRVPEKHRVSFYDTLGFDRQPPQPAQLPIAVEVADGAGGNATIPAGTVATAEPPSGEKQPFETSEAFDATPANLQAVYSVDPGDDAVFEHLTALSAGDDTTLFDEEENLQEHALYLGDAERLTVGPGSTLTVTIDADADPEWLRETLEWQYYGERSIGGETVEGWYRLPHRLEVLSMLVAGVEQIETDLDAQIEALRTRYAGAGVRWASKSKSAFKSESESTRGRAKTRDVRTGTAEAGVEAMETIRAEVKTKTMATWGAGTHRAVSDYRDLQAALEDLPDLGPETGDSLPPWAVDLLSDDDPAELTFVPDGTLTETAVDGVESTWIRCRIPDDVDPDDRTALFDLRFGDSASEDTPVTVGASAEGLEPDAMLHNDVPQPEGSGDDAGIHPFGERPRQQATFSVASTDALTKTGATVTVRFDPESQTFGGSGGDAPVLSWEFFDGEGWSRLPVDDGTDGFTDFTTEDSTVAFEVPAELSETTVAGHEGHWIRARLVGGDYGELSFTPKDDNSDGVTDRYVQQSTTDPPAFSAITLSYDQTEPPDHVVAENNLGFGPDHSAAIAYRPFKPLPVDEQTLYLGFDAPLRDGPINLLFDLEDAAYPQAFHPQVRWEYVDSEGAWTRPDVLDGTEGLTERGIVGLVFPDATASTREFGRDLHWVRARVSGEAFDDGDGAESETSTADEDDRACGRSVETVPPAGEPRRSRPLVRGLYPNAGWARNRRTVDGEVPGSSDGTVDQTFSVAAPPVVDGEVWIDELTALSEGAREDLREQWPDRTELETDAAGDSVAFWVRWDEQPDLLDSGPEDRHYTLDPIAGTVSFGDGVRGKIPPRGTDNVRADYATGGGAAGNVPVGSVSGFRQSIAFVDGVTNPIAGDAGADAEPTAAVTDRAARELRDRNRAVAPADFERIAMDASRQLARARCLPAMDRAGEYRPGWVTLLVVPRSSEPKPTPSVTLRDEVERAVAERAPATLVDGERRLVVRGPSYVSVSVDADLAATGGSVSQLEARAREAVRAYLHPLTGGESGDGWRFGELPCRSDVFELLERIEGVDHVADLTLRFETSESLVAVTEGRDEPETSPDALIYAGTQELTARLVDGGGR